ncbi:hypothetical protein Ddc_24331 [Ditylenchus destructor]|nr:hypothetical protein Ddc_24331 [Ditylenchus destructor]
MRRSVTPSHDTQSPGPAERPRRGATRSAHLRLASLKQTRPKSARTGSLRRPRVTGCRHHRPRRHHRLRRLFGSQQQRPVGGAVARFLRSRKKAS